MTASISNAAAARTTATQNACEPEILRASDNYGIPLGILYSVGLAETGRKGSLQPNALNIGGKVVFPKTKREALAAFAAAQDAGTKFIDLGCMQINHHYHASHFKNVADMLDPHQNVDYAARFLVTLHGRHETWSMAVARYHAGPDNDPAQKRLCLPGHRQHGRHRLRKMDCRTPGSFATHSCISGRISSLASGSRLFRRLAGHHVSLCNLDNARLARNYPQEMTVVQD